ncbi:DMT family transporter [Methanococcoides sp. AM1]|uniref:DMT family transporter n=1 Tax=Methanococcoides sp. AM1 TaxID=1201011 RepID=UPI0010836290|nr:DMT family transporter [Methanococcoides sp. AM1]
MIPTEFLVVIFGLLAAASWGASDFSGGFASKKANVYGVVLIVQIVGLILLVGSAFLLQEQMPPNEGIIWGILAGLFISAGLIALYRALSEGKMGFVAPLSAVVTAAIPVIYGAFHEGIPSIYQMIGFVFAVVAVWLIASGDLETKIERRDFILPLIAGTLFGLFFISIDRFSETAVLWPLAVASITAILIILGFVIFKRSVTATSWNILPKRNVMPIIILSGIFNTGGNAFFALASQAGRLDIASITSSLYPAGTVLLAWMILKENMSSKQWIGVLSALVALILISA